MLGIGPSSDYIKARNMLIRPVETKVLDGLMRIPDKVVRALQNESGENIRAAANLCAIYFNAMQRSPDSLDLFIKLSGAPNTASAMLKFCGAEPRHYDEERLIRLERVMRGETHD